MKIENRISISLIASTAFLFGSLNAANCPRGYHLESISGFYCANASSSSSSSSSWSSSSSNSSSGLTLPSPASQIIRPTDSSSSSSSSSYIGQVSLPPLEKSTCPKPNETIVTFHLHECVADGATKAVDVDNCLHNNGHWIKNNNNFGGISGYCSYEYSHTDSAYNNQYQRGYNDGATSTAKNAYTNGKTDGKKECKTDPASCGIQAGVIYDTLTPVHKISTAIHDATLGVNGYFINYGTGAYDWIYVNATATAVSKLEEGVDSNGSLRWNTIHSKGNELFSFIDISADGKKVTFGSVIDDVQLPGIKD
jgi:hypothetical protein